MDANVAALLTIAATAEPDKIALSEAATGRAVTWSQLDALADGFARGLSESGFVAGYRVLLAMANRIELVAAYLGTLRAGLIAVPVNPRSATGEMLRMITDSGARLVVADESTITMVRAAVAGLGEAIAASDEDEVRSLVSPRIVTTSVVLEPGERTWEEFLRQHGAVPIAPPDPEATAVLLYTSGTSGRPRGAMLSHRALLANIEQVARVQPPMILGTDVVLGVLPIFHIYGLNAVLGQVLRQHARLVLTDGFDPEGVLDLIQDEAISVLPIAPPAIAHWMQMEGIVHELAPVRLVLSGSAPLSPQLAEEFTERTGLAVHQGYGLTEAAPVVTSTLCSQVPDAGSVGAALPGVEVKLVDDDGRAPEADDGGQIHVRGDNLFSGYWPSGSDGPGDDGWYPTGDVGYLDANGELFLVDRVKELVIVSGFNVYPSEVEDVIAEVPTVKEVAVIGTEDERTGEAVVAYVTPAEGAGSAEELERLVRETCEHRLARFKQPSVIHVVDELPHTVTGKIQKGRLRATERRRALGILE